MYSRIRAKNGLWWLWISVLILLIDRYSKIWAMTHLLILTPLSILPVLNLTLAHNTGAAFGFLHSFLGWQNIFLGTLACVISIVIVINLARLSIKSYWLNIALCLILAGAIGNVWDRVLYGFVIDFISLHYHTWYFAIFNVADSAITVGAIMLFWTWLRR